MASLPYVRFDRALGQLEAGPSLNGGGGGGGGGGAYPFLRGAATTHGPETLVVLSKPLPVGGALWFSARALAKAPGGESVATFALSGRAGRTALALAVDVDSSSAAVPPSLGGAALVVSAAGADVAVSVSGADADVAWKVTLEYDEVYPPLLPESIQRCLPRRSTAP